MRSDNVKIDPVSGRMIMSDTIFHKRLGDGDHHLLLVGDLPDDLLPTDKIYINYDEGYYSENNSWDSFTEVFIYRERLETDEEQILRLEKTSFDKEELRNRRHQSYLTLKKEFEPES